MTAIVIINWMWLVILAGFVTPLCGIWYELWRQRKDDEAARKYFEDLPEEGYLPDTLAASKDKEDYFEDYFDKLAKA